MKDYTKDIGFWKRLQSFVSDIQTNCCMGEEEKQMIIHNCKLKILDIQHVSNPVSNRTFSVDEVKIILEKQKQACANEFIHAEMTMEQAKRRVLNAPTVSFQYGW